MQLFWIIPAKFPCTHLPCKVLADQKRNGNLLLVMKHFVAKIQMLIKKPYSYTLHFTSRSRTVAALHTNPTAYNDVVDNIMLVMPKTEGN